MYSCAWFVFELFSSDGGLSVVFWFSNQEEAELHTRTDKSYLLVCPFVFPCFAVCCDWLCIWCTHLSASCLKWLRSRSGVFAAQQSVLPHLVCSLGVCNPAELVLLLCCSHLCVQLWECYLFPFCYLVDPASSHMLVSKIKPCMCKYTPS